MTERDNPPKRKVDVWLPPELVTIVDDIAERDCSTRSQVLNRLVTRTLQSEGYLDVTTPKRRSA